MVEFKRQSRLFLEPDSRPGQGSEIGCFQWITIVDFGNRMTSDYRLDKQDVYGNDN